MPNQTAISLAVLQVNWDLHKKDYLDNFVPLVAECIRLQDEEVIVASKLKEELENKFGLSIPVLTINTMLRRIKKQDYIYINNGVYYRNNDELTKLNFHSVQQQVIQQHDSLINEMITFIEDTYDIKWSNDEANNHLLACLKDDQLQILYSVGQDSIIPDDVPELSSSRYYCATFIKHLEETQSPCLEFLKKVVEGNMLANAIFLPDPSKISKKFRNTQIFFDTPFLIFALGYAGVPRKEPCIELLELLYETGCNLFCFQHTVDEIIGILETCRHRIRTGAFSDAYGTLEYFVEQDYTESDIQILINSLINNLDNIRIKVVDKPDFHDEETLIDESKLEEALGDVINYRAPQPRERDVASISAIMRLRKNKRTTSIEECKALFITTNKAVAKVSRDFFYGEYEDSSVAPCITDYSLTNLLWLKKPLAMPNLPMKRVIADCYAALQPSEKLIRAYMAKIEEIEKSELSIDSTDVMLLRHSFEARQILMDLTKGDDQVITNATLQEMLTIIKGTISEKARQEIIEIHEKEKSEINEQLEEYRKITDDTNQRLSKAETTINALVSAEDHRNRNIDIRAQKYAKRTVKLIKSILVLLLFLGIILPLPWDFPVFQNAIVNYILSICCLLLLLASVLNFTTGIQLKILSRKLERTLKQYYKKVLTNLSS